MVIATPPTTPSRYNPTTFSQDMDAYLAWVSTSLVPGLNTLAVATGPGQFTAGSPAAPSITFTSDTGLNTGFYWIAENTIGITTGGTFRASFDSSGNFYMGSATTLAGMGAARIQTQGLSTSQGTWNFVQHTANATGPAIALGKTRSAAVDTYTIVQSGDALGQVEFWGADGSTMIRSANIQAYSIGTPAAGDVRGGLKLSTGSGVNTLSVRLTIDDTTIAATLPVTSTGAIAQGFNALTAGTLALAMATKPIVSVTPNATGTFTTTVPPAGTSATLIINTSGVTSFTMTFGTGFKSQGTLATGIVTAKTFVVSFISDGTTLNEKGRTAAM